MRSFEDIAFIWRQTYKEILKSALLYLERKSENYFEK